MVFEMKKNLATVLLARFLLYYQFAKYCSASFSVSIKFDNMIYDSYLGCCVNGGLFFGFPVLKKFYIPFSFCKNLYLVFRIKSEHISQCRFYNIGTYTTKLYDKCGECSFPIVILFLSSNIRISPAYDVSAREIC